MMKRRLNWGLLCISFIILMLFFQFEPIIHYINHLKTGVNPTYPVIQTDDKHIIPEKDLSEEELVLLQKIRKEAAQLHKKPINARVDPVWKAIPGYNGVQVDISQTFKYAKKLKGKQIPFVFEEIPPRINIEQLGPQPIYKGNPQKPMVSIMINVAWGNEYIPSILDTLKQENVHATFFLDGSWLEKNVDTAKKIQELGHELSNHAYSHKNMSRLSQAEAIMEISKTQKLLKDLLHVDNQLFAPPSGDFDEETVSIAHQMKLKTILWTIDTVDWKNPKPSWIVKKIATRLEPGALILMHPKLSSSKALPQMIQEIKRKGLYLGTVSELISSSRVDQVETHIDF